MNGMTIPLIKLEVTLAKAAPMTKPTAMSTDCLFMAKLLEFLHHSHSCWFSVKKQIHHKYGGKLDIVKKMSGGKRNRSDTGLT